MDPAQLLLYGIIGLIGGLLSGLIGVGGRIFFVPALVYAAGWNIKEAVAASLVIIIFSSLSGTIRNAKSRDPVNWRVAALLSVAVAPSSLIGVAISRVSPDEVVKICFAVLILALALPTARGRKEIAEDGRKIPAPLVFVAGIFIGALSGLVGVGGGIMMVPLMVLGLGVTMKRAVSTSLAVAMFTGIVGAAGYVATGFRDPQELLNLLPLVAGSIIGAWLGVHVRDPLPDAAIRVGFGVFMVVVSLRILVEAAGLF